MIRRVAAMPGDQLVAFEGEDHEETFVVPQVRCVVPQKVCCTLFVVPQVCFRTRAICCWGHCTEAAHKLVECNATGSRANMLESPYTGQWQRHLHAEAPPGLTGWPAVLLCRATAGCWPTTSSWSRRT